MAKTIYKWKIYLFGNILQAELKLVASVWPLRISASLNIFSLGHVVSCMSIACTEFIRNGLESKIWSKSCWTSTFPSFCKILGRMLVFCCKKINVISHDRLTQIKERAPYLVKCATCNSVIIHVSVRLPVLGSRDNLVAREFKRFSALIDKYFWIAHNPIGNNDSQTQSHSRYIRSTRFSLPKCRRRKQCSLISNL